MKKAQSYTLRIQNNRNLLELLLVFLAFVLLLAVGTIGYMLLEDWGFLDSLYMTVISASTVGFGEIHPLGSAGRIFTMFLILSGVGLFGIALAKISQTFIHQQLDWLLRGGRMNDMILKITGHTIVCGFGRLSRISAVELLREGQNVVIIDRDPIRIKEAQEAGLMTITGDAESEEIMLAAGIKQAKNLLSLLPKAADNLYSIMTARELNNKVYIVSRAEDDIDEKRLRHAGADRVISPYRVGGMKIAESLIRPYVSEFIDLASSSTDLMIEEIPIPAHSRISGKTLRDFGVREKTNIIIAAIVSKDGKTTFNPSGDAIIESGSTLIGLGMRNDIEQLEELVDKF